MEETVDSVAAVRPDDAAVLGLGVLLDSVAKVSYQSSWLNELGCLV